MAKTFKGEVGAAATRNPAMQFIDQPETEGQPKEPAAQPERRRMDITFTPHFNERRSKRVQMLIQPSLYERLKDAADKHGASLNEMMHKLLEYGIDELEKSDKGEQ